MHEFSVTEEMLRLVLREANAAGACRVIKVQLAVGGLSTVVEESVRFYWEFMSRGTIAEGALLEFDCIRPLARCRACGMEYTPESRDQRCPACEHALPSLLCGDEFRVEAIEIE